MAQARTTTMTGSIVDQAKKIGDELMGAGAKVFHASMGVVASTEEHARETFERMVDKGKRYEEDDSRFFARATREARELGRQVDQRVERAVAATLNRAGVPSRDEISQLSRRVEELTSKVDRLASRQPAAREESHG